MEAEKRRNRPLQSVMNAGVAVPVVPTRESGSASEWASNLTLKQMFVHYQILKL